KDSAGHRLCLLSILVTLPPGRRGNTGERGVIRPGPADGPGRLDLLSGPLRFLGIKVEEQTLVTPYGRQSVELKPGSLLQEARHHDGPANVGFGYVGSMPPQQQGPSGPESPCGCVAQRPGADEAYPLEHRHVAYHRA